MNKMDESHVVSEVKAILAEAGTRSAVIAFDISRISNKVRNVRNTRLLENVNDVLSGTGVCRELGGIFTVCEYEMSVCFLIQADLAITTTPMFVCSRREEGQVKG